MSHRKAMDPRDKIRNPDCELCPLHESAEYVCLMGDGNINAEVMIVGEAPGAREDESHKAFVGAAGQLLRKTLKEAGLNPSEIYITNVAKCRPPENRTPTRGEAKTCSENYLAKELEMVKPDYVLPVGNAALQGVVGKSGITKHRGRLYTLPGDILALPTFHPAAVLRNPRYGSEFVADVRRFSRLVRSEDAPGEATKVGIIRTKNQLKWLLRQLHRAETISFDIETSVDGPESNLEEWHGDRSRIVSIGYSWEPGKAYVVPLHHARCPWGPARGTSHPNADRVLRVLKPTLERRDVRYVAHNGKFDCRWLAAKGIFVPLGFCTMLAAHMLDENRSKRLKTLSQLLLGVDAYDVGEDLEDAYNMPLRRLCVYNGKDADYTLRLRNIFKEELKREPRTGILFVNLMMPASNTLTKTERVGLWVDQERLTERTIHSVKKRRRLEKKMLKTMPADWRADFNFNSNPQLGKWLFGHLDLPIIEKTAKGAPSSREAVLLRLTSHHDVCQTLLEYRGWQKNISTYLQPWRERADSKSRLHTSYKLFGTVTGRLSSEKPNLQQVPRDSFIRGILGAPKGWVILEADLSQIELRLAAMLAGEQRMLRALALGKDLHVQTAMDISMLPLEKIDKEVRKKGKSSNFSLIYGVGVQTLIDYTWEKFQIELEFDEGKRIRDRFFRSYPKFLQWHDRQRRLVHRYERVTSPLGRTRHLPDVRSGDKDVQAEAERQAINSPVQSAASDIVLLSGVRLDSQLDARVARLNGLVHDSLLFEVKEDAVDEVAPQIKATMEDMDYVERKTGAQITVPIVADVSVGSHWGDVEPLDL